MNEVMARGQDGFAAFLISDFGQPGGTEVGGEAVARKEVEECDVEEMGGSRVEVVENQWQFSTGEFMVEVVMERVW